MKYNNDFQANVFLWVGGHYGQVLGETIAAQGLEVGDYRLTRTVDDFLQTVLYTDRHLQSVFFVLPEWALSNGDSNRIEL